ncbi:CheR family methyltransferase [Natronolimnohabitans innermongolicus]|uniref:protein-glutamate O-methyltransferase n=1 Tax=Natronolimnohabitans innermongolicus JCM 12255 TaxID=1227499 RepID=L9WIJ8_9EURY|nr:protein-glutamate O-methyltransferase CheR [Natronolimnohabitans innermongolicus]ELY49202.1 chemotaxis protein CheR [Natronolimnohabitans innermongolicus JCM 12255]
MTKTHTTRSIEPDRQDADPDFERLLSYIESEYGFATTYYATKYLRRRIRSRLSRNHLERDDYESYLSLLKADDGEERTALLDALSVNVTSFYRDPSIWDGLRDVLETAQEDASGGISIWSVPCSDGREPYSLAMLARDTDGVDANRVSIRASDIDEEILSSARSGVYEQRRTADVASELEYLDDHESYVERTTIEGTDAFEVSDEIKRAVEFDRFDLINDRITGSYDLILCRNFFIYLDANYQQIVLEKLYDALRPGGYFVLGKAETMPQDLKEQFEPVYKRSRIYRRS